MSKVILDIDEKVATLTINSPPANALSSILINKIDKKLDEIQANELVKAVIIKGSGRFFSAGADIKEFTELQKETDFEKISKLGQHVFSRIESFHVPFIAAIHGAALGGGLELALSCHMRLATQDTLLGLPEMTLGVIPGFGGTQRLAHYVGSSKAYEMMLTGEPINGEEALKLGLVNHVFTEDDLFKNAEQLAEKISEKSKPAISSVMHLMTYTKNSQFNKDLDAEANLFGKAFGNKDATEGIQAFIEKRKPIFKDG